MIDTWNPAKLNEKISGSDSWNPAILNEAVTDKDSWNPAILNESAGETPVVFEATITASFPEGATCTATYGTTTLTADNNPMAFNILNEGTWAVACVANGVTFSENVVITTNGQTETVDLTPVGETVIPTDSVPMLIACAGIGDSTYTTISDVIADSDLLEEITTNDNTIAYLVRSTTFAATMVADEDTMAAIGASNGCSDALLSDSTWLNAICNSTYFESVLNVKVPKMTDNTHPSGECSATGSFGSTTLPYKAFDRDTTTYWASPSNTMGTVYYQFAESMKLCCFEYRGYAANNTANSVSIVDSNNVEKFTTTLENNNTVQRKVLSSIFTDSKFGLKVNSMYSTPNANAVEVQFYGRQDV